MALSDFILKARVNVALIRDPRVASLDVGVHADDGVVYLTGDVDTETECQAAAEVARRVDGVKRVVNQLTCGIGQRADTAELVTQRLLEKLDDEWNNLPNQSALVQADYLRWALWMIYKFRIPAHLQSSSTANAEHEAMDQALSQVAGAVGAPKALVALEMLQMADEINDSPQRKAPDIENAPLVATPEVNGDPARAAA
jgi:hypothetical protein